MRKNILVLHGPNLNLLGERQPGVYGKRTLAQLNRSLRAKAGNLEISVRIFQRNGEGQLLDLLHRHRRWAHGLLINPGAYTHYSYALRDGIVGAGLPAVEVHLSDIHRREPWRRISVIAPVCIAQVAGRGQGSYLEGLKLLRDHLGYCRPR
ncbi:MAG: 3-dehydroquinate dehydratase [Elusimicrobia bacterium RIFCSPHIGHO2_02_FULL_57_9]|nr:MAG: 3-dehydroquinate dehydratase [Elusimicrobia bacterium RIFCSPHIGHO2_02_FULL_57_9]